MSAQAVPGLEALRSVNRALVAAMREHGAEANCWPGFFELPPTDGSDPSFVIPIPDYGETLHDLWLALDEAGYQAWVSGNILEHGHECVVYDRHDIGMYSNAQLSKVLRTICVVESLEFGHWAECLRSGLFQKIVATVLTRLTYPDPGDADDFVPMRGNRPYPYV